MTEYLIEFFDQDGRTARSMTVRCRDLGEAHRPFPTPEREAVLIRPSSSALLEAPAVLRAARTHT